MTRLARAAGTNWVDKSGQIRSGSTPPAAPASFGCVSAPMMPRVHIMCGPSHGIVQVDRSHSRGTCKGRVCFYSCVQFIFVYLIRKGWKLPLVLWNGIGPRDYPHGFVADREAAALSTDKISAALSRAHDGFADQRRKILARFLSDRRQTSACAFGSPHATISFTGGAGPFGAAFATSVNALASMSSDMSEPAESRIAAAEEWRRTSAKSPIPFAP